MRISTAIIILMTAWFCLFPTGVDAQDGIIAIHDKYMHNQRVGSMTVEAILYTDFGALQIPLGFDDDRVIIDSVSFLMSFPGNAIQTYMINAENQVNIVIAPYISPIPAPGGEICEVHFHIPDDIDNLYCELDTISFYDGWVIHEFQGWDITGTNMLELGFQSGYLDFSSIYYVCGDLDFDMDVDMNDVIGLISFVFNLGEKSWPAPPGDVDCDYYVNFLDLIYLVNYLFRGGPEPCEFCK